MNRRKFIFADVALAAKPRFAAYLYVEVIWRVRGIPCLPPPCENNFYLASFFTFSS
jgi:hypothetical protein